MREAERIDSTTEAGRVKLIGESLLVRGRRRTLCDNRRDGWGC